MPCFVNSTKDKRTPDSTSTRSPNALHPDLLQDLHAPAGDDADGGSLCDELYAEHGRLNAEVINGKSSKIERAEASCTPFAGLLPTQNQPSEPELGPGMCWGVEIMWSRTFVTELESTHPTLAAANEAAKRLYEVRQLNFDIILGHFSRISQAPTPL